MSHSCLRIRDKPEAVLGRWRIGRLGRRCCNCDVDCSSGALSEVSPEGRPIVERPLLANTLPLDVKRLDYRANEPQRVYWIQAARNGERVERFAHVLQLKTCFGFG